MGAVTDHDSGYRRALQALRDLDVAVDVGILQDQGEWSADGRITLAGYAAVNEFGSADGHTPERSFLRSTVARHGSRYQAELIAAAGHVLDGVAIDVAFGLVGVGAENDVTDAIRDFRDPPNAASTLRKKYPATFPLIDTGRMRQAISSRVARIRGKERP